MTTAVLFVFEGIANLVLTVNAMLGQAGALNNPMGSRGFANEGLHVMAKPIGPICNLNCEYCFYLRTNDLYPAAEPWQMSERTLEAYIEQYVAAQPPETREIGFAWQGGEPTLLGVEFFERVVELQKRLSPPGLHVANALQTNGTLLNDRWCEFFRDNGFLIGLSIDGPPELHDRCRRDKKGRGTSSATLRALKLLNKHEVAFNALVVVNRHNGDQGRCVYTYLRDQGFRFLQFIPMVERPEVVTHVDSATPASILPEQFGEFLIQIFDAWIRNDVGQVFVRTFDEALAAWMGLEPSLCIFRKRCGRALVLEHNGDLFSCDHFVDHEHKLGNIHTASILQLASSREQNDFGRNKETSLPRYCQDCSVRFVCNGGCPKDRLITAPDGEPGLNYLCAGYRQFFGHITPYMEMMAEELRQQRPAANVMHRLRAGPRAEKRGKIPAVTSGPSKSSAKPGRNDPCWCGSGRKFKKCCMLK